MSANDGGPAFPRAGFFGVYGDGSTESEPSTDGMTLRDYFAAQVISQCHITVTREEREPDAEVIRIFAERYARTAYVIADAMLRARAGAGVLLLCLLLPSLAHAQGAVGAIVLGNVADIVSTEIALQRPGLREGNPVLGQSATQRIAVKAAGTAVQVWIVRKLDRSGHPKLARVVGYSAGAALTGVAWHNWRAGR
jgi:hypothetical protein